MEYTEIFGGLEDCGVVVYALDGRVWEEDEGGSRFDCGADSPETRAEAVADAQETIRTWARECQQI